MKIQKKIFFGGGGGGLVGGSRSGWGVRVDVRGASVRGAGGGVRVDVNEELNFL